MLHVFLIFMIGAGSHTDKHIVPMKDMAQCEAAITANQIYDKAYEELSWIGSGPIREPRCIEVKK